MRLEKFERTDEARWNVRRIFRPAEIARDPDDSTNHTRGVAQWKLRGEAPAGAAARIPVEFEALPDATSAAQDGFVLRGITHREFARKYVADMFADQLAFCAH